MKTFTMYRQDVPKETHPPGTVNAPDDPQFQGVLFDDGTVAIRWMTEFTCWGSMADMLAVQKSAASSKQESEVTDEV